jgi:hypothetical protein
VATIYALMRQQKNAIHEEIVEAGMDPSDFDWDEIKRRDTTVPRLTHTPTASHFIFGGTNEQSEWKPGRGEPR